MSLEINKFLFLFFLNSWLKNKFFFQLHSQKKFTLKKKVISKLWWLFSKQNFFKITDETTNQFTSGKEKTSSDRQFTSSAAGNFTSPDQSEDMTLHQTPIPTSSGLKQRKGHVKIDVPVTHGNKATDKIGRPIAQVSKVSDPVSLCVRIVFWYMQAILEKSTEHRIEKAAYDSNSTLTSHLSQFLYYIFM